MLVLFLAALSMLSTVRPAAADIDCTGVHWSGDAWASLRTGTFSPCALASDRDPASVMVQQVRQRSTHVRDFFRSINSRWSPGFVTVRSRFAGNSYLLQAVPQCLGPGFKDGTFFDPGRNGCEGNECTNDGTCDYGATVVDPAGNPITVWFQVNHLGIYNLRVSGGVFTRAVTPPTLTMVNETPGLVEPGTELRLRFTITNPNGPFNIDQFTNGNLLFDPAAVLPGAVVTQLPGGGTNSICGSGSRASLAGSLVTFSNLNVGPNDSCSFVLHIKVGATSPPGTWALRTGPLTGIQSGSPITVPAAIASTEVVSLEPPEVTLAAAPASLYPGQTTRVTMSLTNRRQAGPILANWDFNPAAFLPPGASLANLGLTNCGGGTIGQTGTYLRIRNAVLGPAATLGIFGGRGPTCQLAFDLTVPPLTAGGSYQVLTGTITGSYAGEPFSHPAASASLTVREPVPLTFSMTQSPRVAASGTPVTLTYTIANPNSDPFVGAASIGFQHDVAFFAPGAVITSAPANPCGPSSVVTLTNTAGGAQPNFLTLGGGSLAPGQFCRFSVTYTLADNAAGPIRQQTGPLSAQFVNGVKTTAAAADTITATGPQPLQVGATIVPHPAEAGQTGEIRVSLGNTNAGTTLRNTQFDFDPFAFIPSVPGHVVNGVTFTGACGSARFTALSPTLVRVNVDSIAPTATCTAHVSFTLGASTPAGNYSVQTSQITSAAGLTPLILTAPPVRFNTQVQAFAARPLVFSAVQTPDPAVASGGVDGTYRITVRNPNGVAAHSVSLIPVFPTVSPPDYGLAFRFNRIEGCTTRAWSVLQSSLNDGTILPGETCTIVYDLSSQAVTDPNNFSAPPPIPVEEHWGATIGGAFSSGAPALGQINYAAPVVLPDTTPPVISGLPPTITVAAASGAPDAVVTWPAATVTDDVAVASYACTPTSGSRFAIGTHTVTCTATDTSGNSSQATIGVTVNAGGALTISGAQDAPPLPPGGSGTYTFVVTNPGGTAVTQIFAGVLLAPTWNPGGPRETGITMSLNSLSGDCTPAGVSVTGGSGGFGIVDAAVPAGGRCVITVNMVAAPTLATGTVPVTVNVYTLPSSAIHIGPLRTGDITVGTPDTTPPVITAPNIATATDAGKATARIDLATRVSVSDNSGETITPGFAIGTTTIAAQHDFPLGITTVTANASDSAGNSASQSFTVTVSDTEAPVISGLPNPSMTVEATGATGANAGWAAPTITDNVGVVSNSSTHAPGDLFAIGTTRVDYSAQDAAGNIGRAGFDVIVQDTTGPSLLGVPAPYTLTIAAPATSASLDLTTLGVTAVDLVDGPRPVAFSIAGSAVSGTVSLPLGQTRITMTALDSRGNAATPAQVDITVVSADTAPPVITAPADITVATDPGQPTARVTFSLSAHDAVDGAVVPTLASAPTTGLGSGSDFPIGTTTLTANASDAAGNSAQARFTVTVEDREAPVITPPADIDVLAAPGAPEASLAFTAQVRDNSGQTIAPVYRIGSSVITSPHPFAIGTTVVTIDATDTAGNAATQASFTVTVTAQPLPTIALSSDHARLKLGETAQISFALSAPSTDFTIDDITVSGGTLSGFSGAGQAYSVTFNPDAASTTDGVISVPSGAFSNGAGLFNADGADPDNTVTIAVNTVIPTAVIDNVTGPTNGAYSARITLSEPSSDFTADDLVMTNLRATLTGSGAVYGVILRPVAEGPFSIHVAAGSFTNAGGNANAEASNQINGYYDVTRPTVSLSTTTTQFSGRSTIAFSVTFSENVTGFDTANLVLNNATAQSLSGSGSQYTLVVETTGRGDVSVQVAANAAQDIVGNPSLASNVVTVSNQTVQQTRVEIAEFMAARTNQLLTMQPDLSCFLTQDCQGGSALFTATRGEMAFDLTSRADWPVWFMLRGSRSSDGLSANDYAFGALGAHRRFGATLLVGVMLQFDYMRSATASSTIQGAGWMVGPYFVARPFAPPVYFEGRLLAGQTRNRISPLGTYTDRFDTDRVLAELNVTGSFPLGEATLRPRLSAGYARDAQRRYTDSLGNTIAGQSIEQFQVALGLDISRPFYVGTQPWTLDLGVRARHSSTNGSGVPAGVIVASDGLRGEIRMGVSTVLPNGMSLSFSASNDGLGSSSYQSTAMSFDLNWDF